MIIALRGGRCSGSSPICGNRADAGAGPCRGDDCNYANWLRSLFAVSAKLGADTLG